MWCAADVYNLVACPNSSYVKVSKDHWFVLYLFCISLFQLKPKMLCLFCGLYLTVSSAEADRKHGGERRVVTCNKGP